MYNAENVEVNQSPTAKISPTETNPENTYSHRMAFISSFREDKLNL